MRSLALCALLAAAPSSEGDRTEAAARIARALTQMRAAVDGARDLTCTFHKVEWKGRELPEQVMALELRTRPRSLHVKWLDADHRGQELVWRQGWNRGRMRVRAEYLIQVVVDLELTSPLAASSSRHTLDWLGFERIAGILEQNFALARERPECVLAAGPPGHEQVAGAASTCFEAELDKGRCPELYARRARFCLDDAIHLPNRLQIWDREDGEVRLVEDYTFADIRVNPGLGEKDFDPRTYGF